MEAKIESGVGYREMVAGIVSTENPIVRLALSQAQQGAAMLGRAFHDDPMFVYALPDGVKRARALPWLFGALVRYGILYGEVYTTIALDGVAIWLCPGYAVLSLGGMARAGMFAAPRKLGPAGLARFIRTADWSRRLHERSLSGRHQYLLALGVEPPRQGMGIGGALIRPVLERADVDGLPCYLDTMKQTNVMFYEKRGFRVTAEGRIPGGPRVWAMVREPVDLRGERDA